MPDTKQLHKLHIKNMICSCCIRVVSDILKKNNIEIKTIKQGYAEVIFNNDNLTLTSVNSILEKEGFGLVMSREHRIVEEIKIAVRELIHEMNNVNSIVQKSEYITEKLNMSYQYLSKIFSKYENTTLEKYIIHNKIERIKELIDREEYTLSEIAYMMDYSSVQYLSIQFKKESGMTVSEYKRSRGFD